MLWIFKAFVILHPMILKYADELGYRIKLLGVAKRAGDRIVQSMEPCLVPIKSALGNVEGVF